MKTEWIQVWIAALQLLFGLILIGITWWYARATRRQTDAAAAPFVVVYPQLQDPADLFVLIIIENIGKGLATDIEFEVLKDGHPANIRRAERDEIHHEEQPVSWGLISGPIANGIPGLAPGDSRKVPWGHLEDLRNLLASSERYDVVCRFKGGRNAMPPVKCILEIASFEGVTIADLNHARRQGMHLHRIASALEKLSEQGGDLR